MDRWGEFRALSSSRVRTPRHRDYRRADTSASLSAAIAGIRESAQDRADAIRAEAEAAAVGVLHEAEVEVAQLEAAWAIATHQAEPTRLLKPKQAAEFMGVGVHVVYELLRDGTLPAIQIGTRRYLHRAIVEEYVDRLAGRIDPTAPSVIAAATPPVEAKEASEAAPRAGSGQLPWNSGQVTTTISTTNQDPLPALVDAIAEQFGLMAKPELSGSSGQWYDGNYLRLLFDAPFHHIVIANELDLGGPTIRIERSAEGQMAIHVPEQTSSLLVEVAGFVSQYLDRQ